VSLPTGLENDERPSRRDGDWVVMLALFGGVCCLYAAVGVAIYFLVVALT
jgi:hypothetical protein